MGYLNKELIISVVDQYCYVDMKVKVEWENGYRTGIQVFECLIWKNDCIIKNIA